MKKLLPITIFSSMLFVTGNGIDGHAETSEDLPSAESILTSAAALYDGLDGVYYEVEKETTSEHQSEELLEKQWIYDNEHGFFRHSEITEDDDITFHLFTDLEDPDYIFETNDKKGDAERYENPFPENNDLALAGEQYEYLLENAELTFKGEEEVNGYETYHIEAAHDGIVSHYWFDQETFYEVKHSYNHPSAHYSSEVVDYELNPEFDESLFRPAKGQ
ncbi:hypothetical protein [Jeotgalibacillus proteolyticus]|uniref:Uncharacterized protein n=1 Tax=Jeotgalibacillus proteolyticus TaxID=2082395 RepID=A0A2S5G642_9BACL|nr:hypothetical protein [Jeotgalibacillus proteolyticus]PPA68449.1 hypothetical protein C4B60_21015 [Jeotgalibacillus proteolyticus]